MYEYQPTNNIDFNSLDFVALLSTMGINIDKAPVLLGILDEETRFAKAMEYGRHLLEYENLPKNYLRDMLTEEVRQQHMTSLDKAWIVLHVNRILKDLDS